MGLLASRLTDTVVALELEKGIAGAPVEQDEEDSGSRQGVWLIGTVVVVIVSDMMTVRTVRMVVVVVVVVVWMGMILGR